MKIEQKLEKKLNYKVMIEKKKILYNKSWPHEFYNYFLYKNNKKKKNHKKKS